MDHNPLITINGTPVKYKTWRFPSGELGLELEMDPMFVANTERNYWYAELVTSEDVFILSLIRWTLFTNSASHNELELPYVPHGRQDRNTTPTAPFSLLTICKAINDMLFDLVTVTTPHSNVTKLLLDNSFVQDVEEWVADKLSFIKGNYMVSDVLFVAPDAGAEKRVYAIAKYCGVSNVMTCLKRRDPATGNILGLQIPDDFSYFGKHVVVIDDICDGGATFIHLAEALKKKGIVSDKNDKTLSLLVTHGIFSNGARERLKAAGYDHVEAKFTFIEERLKNA